MNTPRVHFLKLLMAVLVGMGGWAMTASAVNSTDLITLCFRGRTVQVPFYLAYKYYAFGAVDGACPVSNP